MADDRKEPASTPRRLTRRELLGGAAGLAMAGAFGLPLACRRAAPPPERAAHPTVGPGESPLAGPSAGAGAEGAAPSPPAGELPRATVVLVRHEQVLGPGRRIDAGVLAGMLEEGVTRLTAALTPDEAWARLFTPRDIVGIKSNHWRFLPTPPELEQAIRQRLLALGIPEQQLAVDDRGVRTNLLFARASALINVRPARTHHWAGVGSCIKNYIMFADDPPGWHADACADLAGLWELPTVRGKTRLNILVMLTPLFHGKGPHHFDPRYTWEYKGLLLGTDPVAVDATGLRILQAQRRLHFGSAEPLPVSPKHVAYAETRHRLGVADPARIEVVKLGWAEGALI
ncbi:MAG: DUF362 domain-containing protein [Deltaproteobacteria bacterium]|nr:DUF362 domain-containing protein [Deltaproteobacteria bacterium]